MVLQRAYQALCTEPYRLPYLGTSQFAETRILDIMQFNHVIALTLDLLNTNKYIPKVVIIHTGQSNFGVMPQHLVKFFTAQMANSQGLNLKSTTIQASSCRHVGVFISLMLPEQWYVEWNAQKAAQRA